MVFIGFQANKLYSHRFSILRPPKTMGFLRVSAKQTIQSPPIQSSFSTLRPSKPDGFHMCSSKRAIQSSFSILRASKTNGFHKFSISKLIQSHFSSLRKFLGLDSLLLYVMYMVTRQVESYIMLQSIWGVPLACLGSS